MLEQWVYQDIFSLTGEHLGLIIGLINNSFFIGLNPYAIFWFFLGIVLCCGEFLTPRKKNRQYNYYGLFPGFAALIVGLFSWRYSSLVIFSIPVFLVFRYQVAYCIVLATISIIWLRPLVVRSGGYKAPEVSQAKTLTEIPPGEIGRVMYEGVSWPAQCFDRNSSIPAHQKVYILRREGNILIVTPERL